MAHKFWTHEKSVQNGKHDFANNTILKNLQKGGYELIPQLPFLESGALFIP